MDLRQEYRRRHAIREEITPAPESLGVVVPDWTRRRPRLLSASFFLRELVHTLMGQPEKTSGIARAHLQFSGSQDPDGASSRSGCTSVFFVGLLAKSRVGPNRPCRGIRQFHVVHDGSLARIVDESSSASRMRRRASSTVRPCVWQPRTPRTVATHQPDSSRS